MQHSGSVVVAWGLVAPWHVESSQTRDPTRVPCIRAAAKSLQSCPTLCDPTDWSGLPFPSPMHESEKWKSGRF